MRRLWLVLPLLIAYLFAILVSQAIGQVDEQTQPLSIAFETSHTGLTLTWTSPAYSLTTLETAGNRYSQIQMTGLTVSERPGYPQLPIYSNLIGLPPTGEVWLRVTEAQREMVSLSHLPLPAPALQPVYLSSSGLPDRPSAAPISPVTDPAVYAAAALYPDAVAQLGAPQWVRGRRVALLTIYPARVNPVAKQMEVVRFLRLEITFEQPVTLAPAPAPEHDPFAQALSSILVDPAAARWLAPRVQDAAQLQSTDVITGNPLKVVVDEAGLYALTYDDLVGAGLPVDTLDPRTLQLTHGLPRQEIAIQVEGESDGVFDSTDRVLFYAEPEFSRFSDTDVYLLDHGQSNGLRMIGQSGNPDGLPTGTIWRTAQAETNRHYVSLYAGRDGDHWYWDNLRQPDFTSGIYAISLDAPEVSAVHAATLTLWLQGYTNPIQNPDHRVRVSVNDTAVGEITWDGAVAVEASLAVSASLLRAGENQIMLSLPGIGVAVEGLWLDAFELVYRRTGQSSSGQMRFQGDSSPSSYTLTGWESPDLAVYEISDPANPLRLSEYSVFADGDVHTLILGDLQPSAAVYLVVPDDHIKTPLSLQPATILNELPTDVDYIIITHPDLAEEVAPLAAHRDAQGLDVLSINVNSIYDTYGAGRMSSEAIRAFLQHIYSIDPVSPPLFVLLVGDGSYDFKNYTSETGHNLIPPYLTDADPQLGETAADNRYACVDGDDTLPDLMLGRLPVKTAQEARIVVDKIIQYETNPYPGGWNENVLLVADDADSSGDFPTDSDNYAASQVVAPFSVIRDYCDGDNAWTSDCSTQHTEALHTDILSSWNQGVLLVQFTGHSSWQQWAAERFFHLDDLPALHNDRRLPVVLEMTCFTAAFQRPELTLDENLLTLDGGGAVAVWGGTGLGVGTGHNRLAAGFHHAVFDEQVERVGEATLAGKLLLASIGQHLDLLDTYILLGDPALELDREIVPWAWQVFLPSVLR